MPKYVENWNGKTMVDTSSVFYYIFALLVLRTSLSFLKISLQAYYVNSSVRLLFYAKCPFKTVKTSGY